jgi:hypothetical protein
VTAALVALCSAVGFGCDCSGDDSMPRDAAQDAVEAVDSGPREAGPGDAGPDDALDAALDAAVDSGRTRTRPTAFQSSGGGAASSASFHGRFSIGAPQPMGEVSSSTQRVTIGPSAVRP